jgi:hypothetical protein
MLFKHAAIFLLTTSVVSAWQCPADPSFVFTQCSYIDKSGKEVPLKDDSTIPVESACTVQCTGNYGKELLNGDQVVPGISLVKFSVSEASLAKNGDYDEWNPTVTGGKTYRMNSGDGTCVPLKVGEPVTVEAIMNNGANSGRGEICAQKQWPVVGGCPTPKFELRCVESVNPSGKNIPTAGTSLEPKVSPHQNPDGFYTFGVFNTCGEPTCIDGYQVRLFSGLGPNGETNNLAEYPGPIQNLRGDQRGYMSCDTVKYTQFANGKTNTEKKIGSDPQNVRAHLQGSGDLVVKAIVDGQEQVAYCRVPKPPARA